jgi:hypothetical protein
LEFSGHETMLAIRVPEILSPPQPRQQFAVDVVKAAVAEKNDIVTASDLILKTSEFLAWPERFRRLTDGADQILTGPGNSGPNNAFATVQKP